MSRFTHTRSTFGGDAGGIKNYLRK